jgi:hypothetical protein
MRRRLKAPALVWDIENAWTEEARRNRSANFLLPPSHEASADRRSLGEGG